MIKAGTSDPDVHVAYAALLRESGNHEGAQRHLLSHYKMNPVGKVPKSARAQVPRLLYARGFEETFPMIARRSNGTYAPGYGAGTSPFAISCEAAKYQDNALPLRRT